MVTVNELLEERRKTHGDYTEHAECTQQVLKVLMAGRNWNYLPATMKESLHMFAHKMGRIVTGNPAIKDHWDDIAGYATLISNTIKEDDYRGADVD